MLEFKKATKDLDSYFKWRIKRSSGIVKLAKKYINLNNKKVLDIGCGQGALSYLLVKENTQLEAIDIEKKHLEFLKKMIISEKLSNINVKKVENEILPYKNKEFDSIFSFDVFEHIKNPIVSFNEMVRCLKKGGYIFMELTPYYSLIAGHHLYTFTFLPVQYLPKKIMKAYIYSKKRNNRETPQSQWEVFETLNKISIKKIKKLIKKNKLKLIEENFTITYPNLFENNLKKRKINWIKHFGFLKEIIPTSYQLVLKKE